MHRLHGAGLPLRQSSMRMSWNTSHDWHSEASCLERPKMGFQCTFPNTITNVSTVPKPHMGSPNVDEVRLIEPEIIGLKMRCPRRSRAISLVLPGTYPFP